MEPKVPEKFEDRLTPEVSGKILHDSLILLRSNLPPDSVESRKSTLRNLDPPLCPAIPRGRRSRSRCSLG